MTEPKDLHRTINLLVLFSLAAAVHAFITQLRLDAMSDWRSHIDLSIGQAGDAGTSGREDQAEDDADDARVRRLRPRCRGEAVTERCDHKGSSMQISREKKGNTTIIHWSCQRCGQNWDEYR
jgi:hypothetical protein